MCGRYAFDDSKEIFEARAIIEKLAENIGDDGASCVKTGDVFPSETAAVLAYTENGSRAQAMTWGYKMRGTKRLIINARCETAHEKPMFAASLRDKRCLIPCTGFYEWKALESRKQKYLIRPEGVQFFFLAGLYRRHHVQDESCFVILTAPANKSMKDIHDRMPLIVIPENADVWLSKTQGSLDMMRRIYAATTVLEKLALS